MRTCTTEHDSDVRSIALVQFISIVVQLVLIRLVRRTPRLELLLPIIRQV